MELPSASKLTRYQQQLRQHTLPYLHFFWQRLKEDRITLTAGHLAYVTVLSLVPMFMVLFSVMSAFPVFRRLTSNIESFIFSNFVPTAGDLLQKYLHQFATNASQMTAIGIAVLIAVALLLIGTIDKSLNTIWRSNKGRSLPIAFSVYWMILTLGPILLGASIAASSYVISMKIFQDDRLVGLGSIFLSCLPFILSVLVFLLMFTIIPHCRVRLSHALCGAAFSAALFELAKRAFALYVTHFPTYQLIYGALATIPILLLWIYWSWFVVLLGAEVTASLGAYQKKLATNSHQKEST
ncbi:virulence factor BrkB family protein [Dongshaea marina]|uniref:virulence factor BrkB family protein n=1 Tax=Dongshaea marina TaxID=2047966 RepID=UPI000D3E35F6|nr:virulence factor BrkB family protein [Dongshaea marina]